MLLLSLPLLGLGQLLLLCWSQTHRLRLCLRVSLPKLHLLPLLLQSQLRLLEPGKVSKKERQKPCVPPRGFRLRDRRDAEGLHESTLHPRKVHAAAACLRRVVLEVFLRRVREEVVLL